MFDRATLGFTTALLAMTSLVRDGYASMGDRLKREDGQAFVEYALVLVVIALAIGALIVWTPLTEAINAAIERVAGALNP